MYASYVGGKLTKVVMIVMREHNATMSGAGFVDSPVRLFEIYEFQLPNGFSSGSLLHIPSNGGDALRERTFRGRNYAAELGIGKLVRLSSVTTGEQIMVGR